MFPAVPGDLACGRTGCLGKTAARFVVLMGKMTQNGSNEDMILKQQYEM